MKLLNKIKTFMAKLEFKKFVPNAEEMRQGATPMTKEEVLEQLTKYKAQNPVKYEAKKAALFAKYGFSLEDEKEPVKDDNDLELEALKKKTKKA
jgi:hypothetical protein